ncbi:MAG TPA: hypothetical protein VNO31_12775 [Umezawaea sp.]|nr:hypothetical protein [Umezawaea sp.]
MEIRGYATGAIAAEAAFTADFAIPREIGTQCLVDMLEIERRSMDVRPGMRHKYTPLRFEPATGAALIGGRYLFDTWSNVVDYDEFTTDELEFEPGVKFWSRPFFLGVERHIWRVAGAHDFTSLATTHHVNRLERWTFASGDPERELERAWPQVRDAAGEAGLAGVWLMYQPHERQIGVLTVAERVEDADPVVSAARSIEALERNPSGGRFLPAALEAEKVFDRTSLILSMWLPESRLAGGAPSAYPSAPVHPLPRIERQHVAW